MLRLPRVPPTLVVAALALIGVAKAGAVVFLGLAVGAPLLLVSIGAALWMTGPPTCAWLVAQRRAAAVG